LHSAIASDLRRKIYGQHPAQPTLARTAKAIYFTTEAEARDGERKEPPPQLKAQMDQMNALNIGEPEFFDLTQPWLYSPR
jgi:hypothetical protein